MNITEALQYIDGTQWFGSKPGLERTEALLDKLGRPQDRLKYIHIAGTNGKGSCAAMLASILKAAGYRTGLYTSPYLFRFHERMQINGEPVSDEALAELVTRIRPLAEAMDDHPTEFELITAAALLWFAEEHCDIVVLEVGLGGRLDATNVIAAPEAVIVCPAAGSAPTSAAFSTTSPVLLLTDWTGAAGIAAMIASICALV